QSADVAASPCSATPEARTARLRSSATFLEPGLRCSAGSCLRVPCWRRVHSACTSGLSDTRGYRPPRVAKLVSVAGGGECLPRARGAAGRHVLAPARLALEVAPCAHRADRRGGLRSG